MEPFTPLPNWLITAMPNMPASVFQICVVIARQTFGYDNGNGGRREWDRISLTQFQKATGLSRQGIVDAIEKGDGKWFTRRKVGQYFEYKLVNSVDQLIVKSVDYEECTSQLSVPELVNSVDQLDPKLVNSVDTQKKEIKKVERKVEATATATVFDVWQKNMPGTMTELIAEGISELLDEYSEPEILEAIRIACERNNRTLGYVRGILRKGVQLPRASPGESNSHQTVIIQKVEDNPYL